MVKFTPEKMAKLPCGVNQSWLKGDSVMRQKSASGLIDLSVDDGVTGVHVAPAGNLKCNKK